MKSSFLLCANWNCEIHRAGDWREDRGPAETDVSPHVEPLSPPDWDPRAVTTSKTLIGVLLIKYPRHQNASFTEFYLILMFCLSLNSNKKWPESTITNSFDFLIFSNMYWIWIWLDKVQQRNLKPHEARDDNDLLNWIISSPGHCRQDSSLAAVPGGLMTTSPTSSQHSDCQVSNSVSPHRNRMSYWDSAEYCHASITGIKPWLYTAVHCSTGIWWPARHPPHLIAYSCPTVPGGLKIKQLRAWGQLR